MTESTARTPRDVSVPRRWLASPWLLAGAVVSVYLLSLSGGWLEYDDDWLVRDNELLTLRDPGVLARVLLDFRPETRLVLGAEYLPVRDVVTWLGRAWLGLEAFGFRLLALGLYAGACGLVLKWTSSLASLCDDRLREPLLLSAWLFALHPVHAESVAWLAGLKDVLALLFVAGALALSGRESRLSRSGVVVCVALACASKSVAVVTPALLVLACALRRGRQDIPVLVASSAVSVAWGTVHMTVGRSVGMLAAPLGDSLLERVGSVVVVFARYLLLSFGAHPHSVVYDVPVHAVDAESLGALAVLMVIAALGLWAWRRGVRWPGVAFAWFVVSLLPVSQVVAPLQNRMADRYLLVGVWGPCLVLAMALSAISRRARPSLASGFLAVMVFAVAALAAHRAVTFADRVALFLEATNETSADPKAPLMLGDALMAQERYADAEVAYRTALARDGLRSERGRVAGNSLGRLLAGTQRREEAIMLYERLVQSYPQDPRVLHNLAVLEAEAGDVDASARHREQLTARFPNYRAGARDRPGPL